MQISELLQKSIWTNQDIMDYVGCGMTTASKIHKEAIIKHDGYIPLCPKKVRRDAVLKVLGINCVQEIRNVIYLKGSEKGV